MTKQNPWPLMCYAPGDYWIRACGDCGDSFDGDKYSCRCMPCAIIAAKAEMERMRGERRLAAFDDREKRQLLRDLADAVLGEV